MKIFLNAFFNETSRFYMDKFFSSISNKLCRQFALIQAEVRLISEIEDTLCFQRNI